MRQYFITARNVRVKIVRKDGEYEVTITDGPARKSDLVIPNLHVLEDRLIIRGLLPERSSQPYSDQALRNLQRFGSSFAQRRRPRPISFILQVLD